MTDTKAHAKYRPPSAAKRWLSCAASAAIVAMYPNEPTEASLKGDYQHGIMEDTIRFGFVFPSVEPDLTEYMLDLLAYVQKRRAEMGPNTIILVEQQLDIPQTGEFGTVDIALVNDKEIEAIDYKSGWIPVDAYLNPQMGIYMLGLIAKYGERKKYTTTVFQPTYDHRDGPCRSHTWSPDDIEFLEKEVAYSIANADDFKAGKHCKDTYCPHRGACDSFARYVVTDASLGWHTSEINALPDHLLAEALDHAETLQGYRNELRSEAMRRIMNMDLQIPGYKVVKGRKQRAILDNHKVDLINSVHTHLGFDYAIRLLPDVAQFLSELSFPVGEELTKYLGTAKQVEDVIKQYAKDHKLPRGGWKGVYDNVVGEYIRETSSGLTLEKAIDGRPAHKRGSEFGALLPAAPVAEISII